MTNLGRAARRLVTALTATAALCSVAVVADSAPVSAYTTIYYDGAGSQPRIGLIGDSSLSGVRWYGTFEPLKRLNYTFDAESCRRTIELSCRGREGYAPENGITVLRRLEGRMGKVLVMVTGYNDPGYRFADAVDAIMAEAIRQRIPYVMWLTMRTADVSYVSPTYQSTSYTFRDNNRILLQKAQQYGGRLQIADWATYSADRPDWVTSDGVHMTPAGGNAITNFIVDQSLRVLAGRTVTPPRTTERTNWVTLRRGDRGTAVAAVQSALIRKGYALVGGADGVFGAYTEATLRRFQSDVGLPVTGVADTETAIALGVYRPAIPTPTCTISVTLHPGDRIGAVTCLNRHLYSRGFDVAIQPYFDSRTRTAVDFLNYARGWTRDGIADRAVLTAIEAWQAPSGARPFCASRRALAEGDAGPNVVCLKQHLEGRGYALSDDQRYGLGVSDAVRHYKRHHGYSSVHGAAGAGFLGDLGIWDPPCTISIWLRPGDRIREVVCLEQHLDGRGKTVDLLPGYSTGTTAGVRAVEAAAGLPVNGVADEAMLRAIGAWVEPSGARPDCTVSRVLHPGMRGPNVGCLKRHLRGRGYGVSGDALFGPGVADAVRHFRVRHGLGPGTTAGIATLDSLGIWRSPERTARPAREDPPTTVVPTPSTSVVPDAPTTEPPPPTPPPTPPQTTVPVTTVSAATVPPAPATTIGTSPESTAVPDEVPPNDSVPPTSPG